MELFAPENQWHPRSMLLDLVKLYMMVYDLSTLDAKRAVRKDALKVMADGGELSMVAQAR
jgi:hypothetical protein